MRGTLQVACAADGQRCSEHSAIAVVRTHKINSNVPEQFIFSLVCTMVVQISSDSILVYYYHDANRWQLGTGSHNVRQLTMNKVQTREYKYNQEIAIHLIKGTGIFPGCDQMKRDFPGM